jgi:hypothetical protein
VYASIDRFLRNRNFQTGDDLGVRRTGPTRGDKFVLYSFMSFGNKVCELEAFCEYADDGDVRLLDNMLESFIIQLGRGDDGRIVQHKANIDAERYVPVAENAEPAREPVPAEAEEPEAPKESAPQGEQHHQPEEEPVAHVHHGRSAFPARVLAASRAVRAIEVAPKPDSSPLSLEASLARDEEEQQYPPIEVSPPTRKRAPRPPTPEVVTNLASVINKKPRNDRK